jgi:hypothetical protein
LPWRIAESIWRELPLRAPPAIDAVGDSLRALAARRRRLRAGMFATFVALNTLPAIATGVSPITAISAAAGSLFVASVLLSITFTMHESRAQRRILMRLRKAVVAGEKVGDLRWPVHRSKRVGPAVLLLAVVVLCFSSAVQLSAYPTTRSSASAPLALVAMVALAYLLAVGAGYRPNRWWLIASVAGCCLWHVTLVPPVAHPDWVTDLEALPGIPAFGAAGLLSVAVVYLLRPARLNAPPA